MRPLVRDLKAPSGRPARIRAVMAEMRALASADDAGASDIARLRELGAELDTLLQGSARRCAKLADRLAVVEEHLSGPAPEGWVSATEAATLAQRLRAAG